MSYYMNNDRVKRGEIYYIAHAKCYSTDPSNAAGRPGVIVSSDELNRHSDSVEVVYLTSQEKKPMPTHAKVLCSLGITAPTVEVEREVEKDTPVAVERNLYKTMYEQLLDRMTAR